MQSIFGCTCKISVCYLFQGILESSVKITNEPPTGMLANLHKALDNFNQVSKKIIIDMIATIVDNLFLFRILWRCVHGRMNSRASCSL